MDVLRMRAFRAAPARAQSTRTRTNAIRSIRAQQGVPTLRASDGKQYNIDKALLLGNSPSADITLQGTGVQSEHAKVEYKSGRLFCTALYSADPDNMLSSTATWLEGTELRLGVNYMVAPGSTLNFGSADGNALVAEFEEAGGAGGMADMLMKGMASQASKEVQEQLKNLS